MRIYERLKDQSGATAILFAITLPVLIGFVALAVDVGYVMTTRNELQNVADGSALAATRQLGSIYQAMTYPRQGQRTSRSTMQISSSDSGTPTP
jgi:Flp pilus assembly protein TadG